MGGNNASCNVEFIAMQPHELYSANLKPCSLRMMQSTSCVPNDKGLRHPRWILTS